MNKLSRRSLITGLISFVAAPAIVRVESLMKLPTPKRLLTPEKIVKKVLHKLYNNSHYGVFPTERCWMSYDEFIKIYPMIEEFNAIS